VTSDNVVARQALEVGFQKSGRPDLALPQAVQAVHLAPNVSYLHRDLGDLLQDLGQIDNAIREYQIAIRLSPHPEGDAPIHSNLGTALSKADRLPEALAEYNIAINVDGSEASSYVGRGLVKYRMGSLDAAYPDFIRASQIAPSAQISYWIGRILEDKGELNAAAGAYRQALALTPGMKEAQSSLAMTEEKLHR
jgi:tetratricopeptide (TPR) repeat protein